MRSTTVRTTDDYLRWASCHCDRTSATAEGDLPCTRGPAQLKLAQRASVTSPRRIMFPS